MRVFVCRITDVVADEPRAFAVKAIKGPVIVTIADGELVACEGTCPHEAAPLADGLISGTTLVCGVHFYGFDVRTGKCSHDKTLTLRRFPVTRSGDEIWIDV